MVKRTLGFPANSANVRTLDRTSEPQSYHLNCARVPTITVISAPAGFGKTTLLSAWYEALSPDRKRCLAWISLDAGDNDPIRFWSFVLLALQRIDTSIDAKALTLLQSHRPLPMESVLSVMLNETVLSLTIRT